MMDAAANCRLEAIRCRRLAELITGEPACETLLVLARRYEDEAMRHEALAQIRDQRIPASSAPGPTH